VADRIVELSPDLWNIRGSFRVAKLVDIGTQCTLLRRASGSFLFLDAYTLTGEVLDRVMALTDDGQRVEAVLHLHPFHTIHVKRMAAMFPEARQYGTRRHVAKAPELSWAPEHTEDASLHVLFADDLQFTVPRGVDFVPANENLHFASVLAKHPASGVLHVDDTLMYNKLPLVGGLSFHPTLKQVLQPRAGAAADFRGWCEELVAFCEDVTQVCPAHIHLPPRAEPGAVANDVRALVAKAEKVLAAHEARHG
jgi:hypothetical protein